MNAVVDRFLSCHTALMIAVERNHLDLVKALMKHPEIDLNVQSLHEGYTALHFAVLTHNADIVKQLMSGKNIDVTIRSRFDGADSRRIPDLNAYRLARSIHENDDREQLPGHDEIIRMTKEQKINNDEILNIFYEHDTPIERARYSYLGDDLPRLNEAIGENDEECAAALLDDGDDPNEVDVDGWNALHWAAHQRIWAALEGFSLPLFQKILGMIHNVNAVTNGGSTALMLAARYNHLDLVKALMNHPGIDVNVQDRDNRTALHVAVYENHPDIVAQLLSDYRIKYRLKDNYNRTPLKLAIGWGRHECADLLKRHEKLSSKIKRGLKRVGLGEKEELDNSVVELKF